MFAAIAATSGRARNVTIAAVLVKDVATIASQLTHAES